MARRASTAAYGDVHKRDATRSSSKRSGLEVVDYLPYGAFPAYFYLYAGLAFHLRKGKGLKFTPVDLSLFRRPSPDDSCPCYSSVI